MKVKIFAFIFFVGIICFNLYAQINSRQNNNFDSFSTNRSFDNFDSNFFDNSFNNQPFDNSFNPPLDNSFNPPFDNSFNPPFDNSFNKPFDNNFDKQPLDTNFNLSDNNFDNSFNQPFDSNFNNQSFDNSFNQPADNRFGSRSTRRFERNAQPDFVPAAPPMSCSNEAKQQLNQQLINVYQILEDLKAIVQTQESIEDKKNTSRFLRNHLKELIEKIKFNEMVKANPKFLASYFETVLQSYQRFEDFFDMANLKNLFEAFKTIKLNLGLDLSTLSTFLPN
jgi:hypothetical protein